MTHPSSSETEGPNEPGRVSVAELERALSTDRFSRYVSWAGGDKERALELYSLNVRTSEAMYVPLHALELALRNRIDGVLTGAHGARWFQDPAVVIEDHQRSKVRKAIKELTQDGKAVDPGRVVAALSFGFWTAFLGRRYHQLWGTQLWRITPMPSGARRKRKDLAEVCTQIRYLRNRIAHHEPILHWDLPKHHDKIVSLTRQLSPALADWAATLDRFRQVHQPASLNLSWTPPT